MVERSYGATMHAFPPPQPHEPLYAVNALGQEAPPGYAWNTAGQMVQLPYDPWEDWQPPWGAPDNAAYLEYAAGRATIEGQPSQNPALPARWGKQGSTGHYPAITHGDVALVGQSAYLREHGDEIPQQDEGTGSNAVFDSPASIARTRYILSKEILGIVQLEVPFEDSPLLVQPSGNAEGGGGPAAPFGGAVALATFSIGHLGTQIQITCDVLPGSDVKIPSVDSFMRITGRLSPKYFATSDTGALPNVSRVYLLFPGGPPLTRDSFSNLPPNIMELQGNAAGTVIAAGKAAVPVPFSGWCARGLSPTPSSISLPTRIFRGSVPGADPSPATPYTSKATFPIPFGATMVKVVGGLFNPSDTPQHADVLWTQNLDWAGAVSGSYLPNTDQPVPLLEGATSIAVFGGNSAAAGTEIPFQAVFYLAI